MAKKKLSKKKRRRRLIRRLILLTLLLAFVTTLAIFSPKIVKIIKLAQEAKELVNKSSLDTFMASGTTVIYDTDGNELCTMRESKDMYYVDIGQIPDTLQKSFVVMEDKDFYKHKGIDFKAIIRAVIANTENDEIVQELTIHRHRGFDFWFITQSPSYLHPTIKELISCHFHITRPYWRTPKVYQFGSLRAYPNTLVNKLNCESKFSFKPADSIFKLYKYAGQIIWYVYGF